MDKEMGYSVNDVDVNEATVLGEKTGTVADRDAMARLGKEQLFKRNFGFLSIFGFALIIMGTWEAVLATIAFGLGNGGASGIVYTYIGVFIGFIFVVASMAEMASMAPTSGGQYHWVSEFAPRSCQKLLSYFIGWLGILGYQVGTTIGGLVPGQFIQALILINNPSYVFHRWHATLIAIALTLAVACFNIFLARHLPLIEGLILVLHIAGFFAILIPLWVMAPRTPSDQVWNAFADGNNWGSIGAACLVGTIASTGAFVGGDAAAHMAEELKSASKILPRAMIWTIVVNGLLGFIMLVTFLYTMGDLAQDLSSPTGFPIVQVFITATGSNGGAAGLTSILIVLGVCGNLTTMAGSSRQMFSFARDKGVPFHKTIAKVPAGYDVPVTAVMVSALICCVLHCINIGSAIAFNVILSIGTVALLCSYMVSIGCITWRRLTHQPLLPSKFSLGKFGLAVNLISLIFCAIVFIFAFFPPMPNPPLAFMNWASAAFGGVLLVAFTYYMFVARFHYVGPVEYTKKGI